MNGFLPASLPVRLTQWWQTRDQGDSLSVAQQLADIVGIDYYPRHALLGLGGRTLYLDGARSPLGPVETPKSVRVVAPARPPAHDLRRPGRALGSRHHASQSPTHWMFSCPPDQLIATYNQCMTWASEASASLDAYLFWGAEYWLLRSQFRRRPT